MGFGSPHRIRSRSFQSCRHNFSARYGEQPDVLHGCLGFRLNALWQLVEHVLSLVHPTALLAHFAPDLTDGFPEAERAVRDDSWAPRRDRGVSDRAAVPSRISSLTDKSQN